jgi:hypothetical protein
LHRKEEEKKEEKLMLPQKTAFSLLLLSFFAFFASLRCKVFPSYDTLFEGKTGERFFYAFSAN